MCYVSQIDGIMFFFFFSHLPPARLSRNNVPSSFEYLQTWEIDWVLKFWLLKSFGQFICSSTPFKTKLLNLTPCFPRNKSNLQSYQPLQWLQTSCFRKNVGCFSLKCQDGILGKKTQKKLWGVTMGVRPVYALNIYKQNQPAIYIYM